MFTWILQVLATAGLLIVEARVADELRFRGQDGVDGAQPVDGQCASGGNQIDDRVRHAEQRRDLDRAADLDQLHRHIALPEEARRRPGVRGGHGPPIEILDPAERPVIGNRNLERAMAEGQRHAGLDLAGLLLDQVGAGDSQVDDAVGRVLRDVLGAHEQRVEGEVLAGREEPAVVGLETIAGLTKQGDRRLREPALVRHGQPQAAVRQRPPDAHRDLALRRSSCIR